MAWGVVVWVVKVKGSSAAGTHMLQNIPAGLLNQLLRLHLLAHVLLNVLSRFLKELTHTLIHVTHTIPLPCIHTEKHTDLVVLAEHGHDVIVEAGLKHRPQQVHGHLGVRVAARAHTHTVTLLCTEFYSLTHSH